VEIAYRLRPANNGPYQKECKNPYETEFLSTHNTGLLSIRWTVTVIRLRDPGAMS
jgi:hypothetical protein